MAQSRPLTQTTRKRAPRQRRKKKPVYRIFPASRARSGWMLEDAMWKPNESIGDDASGTRGVDPQSKRRRSRRRAWHEGVANQTVVNNLEDVRSYRAFERALIGSVDPRSALELALGHRLASLLWRLHRANAIEMGLFEIQGEIVLARWQDLSREPSQVGTLQTPTGANGHSKVLGSNGRDYPPDSD